MARENVVVRHRLSHVMMHLSKHIYRAEPSHGASASAACTHTFW
jgi:hypothetical protein